VDHERCRVLEDDPLSRYLVTQVEELIQIDVVSLSALRSSSVKVSKVGLMMLFLSRSDSLMPEPPFFMLEWREVVNSPKCVGTRIEQEPEVPIQNRKKLDTPVWQIKGPSFVRTDGSQGRRWTSMR
jgi:hypothetical protein